MSQATLNTFIRHQSCLGGSPIPSSSELSCRVECTSALLGATAQGQRRQRFFIREECFQPRRCFNSPLLGQKRRLLSLDSPRERARRSHGIHVTLSLDCSTPTGLKTSSLLNCTRKPFTSNTTQTAFVATGPLYPSSTSNSYKRPSTVASTLSSANDLITVDSPKDPHLVTSSVSQESGDSSIENLTPDGWPRLSAVVVGAGPAGALAALVLARQGFRVEVFDGRKWDAEARSWGEKEDGGFDLLTRRGLAALEKVELAEEVEMRGVRIEHVTTLSGQGKKSKRMVQKVNFKQVSISEPDLSEVLIRAGMDKYPGQVTYHFGMALRQANIDKTSATFSKAESSQSGVKNGSETETVAGDLLIGADGLHSEMRVQVAGQVARFSVLSDCRGAGKAVSVTLPPGIMAPSSAHGTDPRRSPKAFLHPQSVTTLVRAAKKLTITPVSSTRAVCTFDGIGSGGQDATEVSAEIQRYFPEVADLFPPDSECCHQLASSPELRQCHVNASQLHHKQTVLLGEAGHACFNNIGQGTNLALEDGLVLENLLEEEIKVTKQQSGGQQQLDVRKVLLIRAVASALDRYNLERKKETDAAARLSEDILKQPRALLSAQTNFFNFLARFLPGFLNWQEAVNNTLRPLSQVAAIHRRQVFTFLVLGFAVTWLVVRAMAAALKALTPVVMNGLKVRFS